MLAQDVFEMVNYAQRIYIISANFVIQALCSVLTRNITTNPPNFSFPALISAEEWIKKPWGRKTRLPFLAENLIPS
jgi:hypothetical protein